MTSSEARRHDPHSEVAGILGPELAETLMSYLPTEENTNLATKRDLDDEALATLTARMDKLDARLDRILLAIIATLIAVIVRSFF